MPVRQDGPAGSSKRSRLRVSACLPVFDKRFPPKDERTRDACAAPGLHAP